MLLAYAVTLAKAGVQMSLKRLDSGLRRNDDYDLSPCVISQFVEGVMLVSNTNMESLTPIGPDPNWPDPNWPYNCLAAGAITISLQQADLDPMHLYAH